MGEISEQALYRGGMGGTLTSRRLLSGYSGGSSPGFLPKLAIFYGIDKLPEK